MAIKPLGFKVKKHARKIKPGAIYMFTRGSGQELGTIYSSKSSKGVTKVVRARQR
ncbi:MAG: hypothetical protein ACJAWN_002650 [Neolewinella sp.]|jgi:hypothetical protein